MEISRRTALAGALLATGSSLIPGRRFSVGETLCISSDTREAAQVDYAWREVHRVTLRGRSQETQVYSID